MIKDKIEQTSVVPVRQSQLKRLLLRRMPLTLRAFVYTQLWESPLLKPATSNGSEKALTAVPNPLKSYFDSHKIGKGIWKWSHYFEIYHRHFSKFVGQEVHVLEVGVNSGGSLDLWRDYFGQNSRIYGVDINENCKEYENDWTRIFIGDQADPEFWEFFKEHVPYIDILIDDGGHQNEQQVVTLEAMLPHIRSGGLYLCEDIGGNLNGFNSYVHGLASNLNAFVRKRDETMTLACTATPFQNAIHSVHLYPFVTVIEKRNREIDEFIAPKHGTEWQLL